MSIAASVTKETLVSIVSESGQLKVWVNIRDGEFVFAGVITADRELEIQDKETFIELCQRLAAVYEGYKLEFGAEDEETVCSECAGTGTVIITSSPWSPEHGTIEQDSCSKCGGKGTVNEEHN